MSGTVLVVVGTRPEAIKLYPVYRCLQRSALRPILLSTGQHRSLLSDVLQDLQLSPDIDLDLMEPNQNQSRLLSRILNAFTDVLDQVHPLATIVQGDTTTVLGATLASYHAKVPVAHVEAGLRTYDHEHPFPEEGNRQLADRLARWCFAPTIAARDNLLSERISERAITVTGNTAIDSLLEFAGGEPTIATNSVLVTLHRRESFGDYLEQILMGIRDFLDDEPEATILWPVHPNPHVQHAAYRIFSDISRARLIEPLRYSAMVRELRNCRFVLTDSGGIQEEAPTFGKRVLVARATTERPEAVAAGWSRVVGRERRIITQAMKTAWSEPGYAGPIPAPNPYGDGKAAERLVERLTRDLS